MNEELISALKIVLADHYALYFKAQGHHWNVEGKNFPQYHEFYSMVYEDAYGAVDMVAENIRKLGAYAPFKMSRFVELTTIPETEVNSDCMSMNMDLLMAVNSTINSVNKAFAAASAANEQGIANDMADRDSRLKKVAWQLRSTLKD